MGVFKFGGASIADAGRMAALLPIISDERGPLLLVLSALGKTTNALEAIVNAACKDDTQAALDLAKELEQKHLQQARELLDDTHYEKAAEGLKPYFGELELAIKNADSRFYDRSYDQVVSMGEIFSSLIFSYYLAQNNKPCEWIDIRHVVRTDETYRDAVVDWKQTQQQAGITIGRKLAEGKIVVTQGFIGSTEEGHSVTLGREGSDYTAAILAAMLGLESVTIWKDVNGLQNADPKLFPDTVKIEAITFSEVIEMAFYGAQIIHPKTIKPLQNANIPLYVKCFFDKSLEGSVIKNDVGNTPYPPLIVLKDNQLLIQATTRDFSFITEDNLSNLYSIFYNLRIKINLIQNAAISFVACIDNRADKVAALVHALNKDYKVAVNENVKILTIRHYTPEIVFDLTKGKQILLRQETRKTLQVIMK
ncbi:MAG: aspartate kinase [Bacteroidota bacterium]